jgi:hypothetical protein
MSLSFFLDLYGIPHRYVPAVSAKRPTWRSRLPGIAGNNIQIESRVGRAMADT